MAIWPEEVSNEGHVYAAFEDDLASLTFWLAFEDSAREPFSDGAEELAMAQVLSGLRQEVPAPLGLW